MDIKTADAYEIALACMTDKLKTISEQANRYHLNPQKWPELKATHERYMQITAAMGILDNLKKQKTIFD